MLGFFFNSRVNNTVGLKKRLVQKIQSIHKVYALLPSGSHQAHIRLKRVSCYKKQQKASTFTLLVIGYSTLYVKVAEMEKFK